MSKSISKCPNCGKDSATMIRIDPGMKLRLQDNGYTKTIPESVCDKCYTSLAAFISQGTKLRAQETAKEQNRLTLWRSRVNLVKEARSKFEQKALSESAVLYEKYLRILEVVYDVKAGQLNPDLFKNSARAKEMTVITSVLWDLFRIYDTSARYGDRQLRTAEKLAAFMEFSGTKGEILKQADQLLNTAKNKENVKALLRMANYKKSKCFVATATFDNPEANEIRIFYAFRDQVLLESSIGRLVTRIYYFASPPLARWIERSPTRRQRSAFFLSRLSTLLERTFRLKS